MILHVLKKVMRRLSTPVQILPDRPADPFFSASRPDYPADLFPWEEPHDDACPWEEPGEDADDNECDFYGADDGRWSGDGYNEDDSPKWQDEDAC